MTRYRKVFWCYAKYFSLLLIALMLSIHPAKAQVSTALTGTVVSTGRNSLTVKTGDGQYVVFTFARGIRRSGTISVGSQVRITSAPTGEAGVRSASEIVVVPANGQSTSTAETLPPEVSNVERDIERSARRYQLGLDAGVGLDPEIVILGATVQLGPIFNPDIYFRPGVEFGFGEVTTLAALNAEVLYRLPISARNGRWTTYVGIGPGFNFTHQSFEQGSGSSRIDFGQFHSDTALNIIGGIQHRTGLFTEIKTSVYSQSAPTLRLIIGYHF